MQYFEPSKKYHWTQTFQLVVFFGLLFGFLIFVYSRLEEWALVQFPVTVIYILLLGWFFRIRNMWSYPESELVIKTQINIYTIVFVEVRSGNQMLYRKRFFNPRMIELPELKGLNICLNTFIGGNMITECKVVKGTESLCPSNA